MKNHFTATVYHNTHFLSINDKLHKKHQKTNYTTTKQTKYTQHIANIYLYVQTNKMHKINHKRIISLVFKTQ